MVDEALKEESAPLGAHGGAGPSAIEGQEPIDHVLYNRDDIFHWSPRRSQETALALLSASVHHHFDGCEAYRRLCRAEGFHPDALSSWSDVERVPLVPSTFFKGRILRTESGSEIVKLCLSSGTQGTPSQVPRDHATLERFLGSTGSCVELLLRPYDHAHVFNLGPDCEEAADLWFSYVMSILQVRWSESHYVEQGSFELGALVDDLIRAEGVTQAVVVGPPVLMLHLVDQLERSGIRLKLGETGSMAVTAGGWKRFGGSAVSRRELTQRLVDVLGLASAGAVRDAFNMVELNTVILECEHHRKHVPPWLIVEARDPADLGPLRPGEVGLLSLLDTTPLSYPGFVLGDDFGRVVDEGCPCGRTAPAVEFVRRVARIEERGCALKLDRQVRPSVPMRGTLACS